MSDETQQPDAEPAPEGEAPLSEDELRAALAPVIETETPAAEPAPAEASSPEETPADETPAGEEAPAGEESPAGEEPPVAGAPQGEAQPEEPPAPPPAPRFVPTGPTLGTGRRKEAVARVRLVPGTGSFRLNGRSLEEYFPTRAHRMEVVSPLRLAGYDKDIDVIARLSGGGISGQAGALQLGIARALIQMDVSLRPALKADGLLTRDSREKERRKYGLKKARKAPQYSKR